MCVESWKWLNFFIYSWAVENSVMSTVSLVSLGAGKSLLQETVNTLVSTCLKTICGSSKEICSFRYALHLFSRNIFKSIWIRTELGLRAWIRDPGRKWKQHFLAVVRLLLWRQLFNLSNIADYCVYLKTIIIQDAAEKAASFKVLLRWQSRGAGNETDVSGSLVSYYFSGQCSIMRSLLKLVVKNGDCVVNNRTITSHTF
jgi:hypothetical protein